MGKRASAMQQPPEKPNECRQCASLTRSRRAHDGGDATMLNGARYATENDLSIWTGQLQAQAIELEVHSGRLHSQYLNVSPNQGTHDNRNKYAAQESAYTSTTPHSPSHPHFFTNQTYFVLRRTLCSCDAY